VEVLTAVSSALDYFLGLGLFGGLYWFLNGLIIDLRPYAMTDHPELLTLANWLWVGSLVLYLILGFFWLPRSIKEWDNKNNKRRY